MADSAVNIGNVSAVTTDHVVVVVADSRLVESGGADRLDAPYETHLGERVQCVVHRLARDGADLGTSNFVHGISGGMRVGINGAEYGESLRRDMDTVRAEQLLGGRHHGENNIHVLD